MRAARSGTLVEELGEGYGAGDAVVFEVVFGGRAWEEMVSDACGAVFGIVSCCCEIVPTLMI